MGDGVLAYFGYPHAREDAAERAVRAGLAIVEAAAELKTGPDLALQLRVGIATGLVVNDQIGEGAQGQVTVGKPLNLAARLQAIAEPGTVVIADSTRRLVGGLFALEDLGCHALKGFTAPVQAWRVTGEGMAESRFEALHGASLTPLVGRGQELTLLLDRWEQAKEGEGQVVLLAGEPGIGKSRLVQALRDRLADEPHVHLGYYCSPHRRDSPLRPVIAQLERAASFSRGDDPGQKLAKLEALLAQGSEDVARVAPLIASLLSIPSGGRYPPLDMSPQLQRERTLAALVDQLAGLAAHRPVLLVWEDVHWADPTSLELLGLAIDRLQSLPVLALVTFRPEFAPPWPGHTHVTWLTLNRLSRRRCGRLVAGLTGGKSLPAVVLDQIVAKAEGVPLFVEELTKAVLEFGAAPGGGRPLRARGPAAAAGGPGDVAGLADGPPRPPRSGQGGSPGRRGHRPGVLPRAAGGGRLPGGEGARRGAAPAGRGGAGLPRGVRSEATYVFKHALVRDAAYASLLSTKRQQLHGRIAQVLEELFPDAVEAYPELLAHHCAQAGMVEKAVGYWGKAGRQAIARSAMAEAAGHLRQALELLPVLPETPVRWQQELDLQTAWEPHWPLPRVIPRRETGEAFRRARTLCEELGDTPQTRPDRQRPVPVSSHRGEIDAALACLPRDCYAGRDESAALRRAAAHRLIGATLAHSVTASKSCHRILRCRREFSMQPNLLTLLHSLQKATE